MGKRIETSVLGVLSRMEARSPKKGSGFVLVITDGTLPRDQYVAVNKVLEAMSGKWNRSEQGHLFSFDPTDRLDRVLLTGEIINEDQALGFFETSEELANRLVGMAGIEDGHHVGEPSAGRGRIARAIRARAPGATIECVEVLDWRYKELVDQGFQAHCADFLSWSPIRAYDRIVMNPPFGRQADLDHVRRAYGFLVPGGRLVSVMANGVKFRENRKTEDFRRLMLQASSAEIIDLPEGSFKESGTGVNTVITVLNRPF